MERSITVRTQFEGVHCWPEAPEEVFYLRHMHRHIFNITVTMSVSHNDREVEFIMVKHVINRWLQLQTDENGVYIMGRTSCEQMAEMVIDVLVEHYGKGRDIVVVVDEDGENGATVRTNTLGYYKDGQPEPQAGYVTGTFADYQQNAYRSIQNHESKKEEVMHWAIGLGEEAGEALSVVKHRYYGGCYGSDEAMLEDLINELGDALWHISSMCTVFGLRLEDIAEYNLAKLAHRYPTGQFDKEQSENRHRVYEDFRQSTEHALVMGRIMEHYKIQE